VEKDFHMTDLAPHADSLVKAVGILFFICLGLIGFVNALIWRNINSIAKHFDELLRMHYDCQKSLPEKYLCRHDFNTWILTEWKPFLSQRKADWGDLYKVFDAHSHDKESGKVMR